MPPKRSSDRQVARATSSQSGPTAKPVQQSVNSEERSSSALGKRKRSPDESSRRAIGRTQVTQSAGNALHDFESAPGNENTYGVGTHVQRNTGIPPALGMRTPLQSLDPNARSLRPKKEIWYGYTTPPQTIQQVSEPQTSSKKTTSGLPTYNMNMGDAMRRTLTKPFSVPRGPAPLNVSRGPAVVETPLEEHDDDDDDDEDGGVPLDATPIPSAKALGKRPVTRRSSAAHVDITPIPSAKARGKRPMPRESPSPAEDDDEIVVCTTRKPARRTPRETSIGIDRFDDGMPGPSSVSHTDATAKRPGDNVVVGSRRRNPARNVAPRDSDGYASEKSNASWNTDLEESEDADCSDGEAFIRELAEMSADDDNELSAASEGGDSSDGSDDDLDDDDYDELLDFIDEAKNRDTISDIVENEDDEEQDSAGWQENKVSKQKSVRPKNVRDATTVRSGPWTDPKWFKELEMGIPDTVLDLSDPTSARRFERWVRFTTRRRQQEARGREESSLDFPQHESFRDFLRHNTEDEIVEISLKGISQLKRHVLGRARGEQGFMTRTEGVLKLFMDLPRITEYQLKNCWVVYLGYIEEDGEDRDHMYSGSATSEQGAGPRPGSYESKMRRVRAGHALPPSETHWFVQLAAQKVSQGSWRKVHWRAVAVFDKISTPALHVFWVESLFTDLFQTLQKGRWSEGGTIRHTPQMEQASMAACPPDKRDVPWQGANRMHPLRQGPRFSSLKKRYVRFVLKLRCPVKGCEVVHDIYKGTDWCHNVLQGTSLTQKYACNRCAGSFYTFKKKYPGLAHDKILEIRQAYLRQKNCELCEMCYRKPTKHHGWRKLPVSTQLLKNDFVCELCTRFMRNHLEVDPKLTGDDLVQLRRARLAMADRDTHDDCCELCGQEPDVWRRHGLNTTLLSHTLICSACHEYIASSRKKLPNLGDDELVQHRKDFIESKKSTRVCAICGVSDPPLWKRHKLNTTLLDSPWACGACTNFVNKRRKKQPRPSEDEIVRMRREYLNPKPKHGDVCEVCGTCHEANKWESHKLNTGLLEYPMICQPCASAIRYLHTVGLAGDEAIQERRSRLRLPPMKSLR